jgi:hypothetical protein
MQSPKRPVRAARTTRLPEATDTALFGADFPDETADAADTHRVVCPDCAQSIALLEDEDVLPEHALCPSPWDPFGLKVCAGTGRPAEDARPSGAPGDGPEQEAALLLTLPQGLDWRMQPFSHVGGPGSRPMRVSGMRRHAA